MTNAFHKEFLSDTVFVYTTRECAFGEDALALATFAASEEAKRVCDLGTGCGIIPLYLCSNAKTCSSHIDAVEKVPAVAAMARASVRDNRLFDRITVHTADWNDLYGVLPDAVYDLLTCNPPYFAAGSGKLPPSPVRAAARFEPHPAMLSELCTAAARLLRPQGRFCLCHLPSREQDVRAALQNAGLHITKQQSLCHENGTVWLHLYEATKEESP